MTKELTQEQREQVDALRKEYLENITKQYSQEEIAEAVNRMYAAIGLEPPMVLVAPSPLGMLHMSKVAKATIKGLKAVMEGEESAKDAVLGMTIDADMALEAEAIEVDLPSDPTFDNTLDAAADLGSMVRESLRKALDSIGANSGVMDAILEKNFKMHRTLLHEAEESDGPHKEVERTSFPFTNLQAAVGQVLERTLEDIGPGDGITYNKVRIETLNSVADLYDQTVKQGLNEESWSKETTEEKSLSEAIGDALRDAVRPLDEEALQDINSEIMWYLRSISTPIFHGCTSQPKSGRPPLTGEPFTSELGQAIYDELMQDESKLSDEPYYVGMWYRAWAGWYKAAELLGVKFEKERLDLFVDFNEKAHTWVAYKGLCVVSANPVECHWSDGELHNDSGPVARWADGFSVWAIDGVLVDEQIVMRPETQTLEQIRNEENAEVKRVRIDRYTWSRYLMEIGAEVLDTRHGEWMESLMSTPDGMTVLCTYDPSTGRPYSLEVNESCKTCEDAQRYLLAPEECLSGLGIETQNSYPVLRT